MSLRDISINLKKHGLSHGISIIKDNNNNNNNNNKSHDEKFTQDYELYVKRNRSCIKLAPLNSMNTYNTLKLQFSLD